MASLGQLTAGIAHEINNPINFVYSSVHPLTKDIEEIKDLYNFCKEFNDLPENPKNREELNNKFEELDPDFLFSEIQSLLSGIKEGADRTKAIVAGLRNFSRLDENEIKPIDIHEGLDSTLMLLRNKLKTRIEVIKNYGTIPQVECYPGKMNQVFMNILNNAAQAIDSEGKITITTWLESEKVFISIKDDGHGFDENVKSRIFEPFYTTKDVGQGTGLGLSISYGIIENHNGKIEINSTPGDGAEFIICLPKKYKYQQ
jgi:signal transduction histidine kinase